MRGLPVDQEGVRIKYNINVASHRNNGNRIKG